MFLGFQYVQLKTVIYNRSEGFTLTGYVVAGCLEDGASMLWENSSLIVVSVAVLARFFLDIFSRSVLSTRYLVLNTEH